MDVESELAALAAHLERVLSWDLDDQDRLIVRKHLVAKLGNIKIEIHSHEHPPPHFHVRSPDINCCFSIADCNPIKGEVPQRKVLKKIEHWHAKDKKHLAQVWNETRPDGCPVGSIAL